MWQAMILALSSTLDDLTVGFSLGMKKGQMAWKSILGIAVMSGLTMVIGLLSGEQLATFLPERIESYISAVVFALFGIWFIWDGYNNGDEEEISKQFNKNLEDKQVNKEKMSWQAIITLGLALGINSLALGFSGGLRDYPLIITSLLTMGFSMLFIWSGSRFGGKLAIWIGDRTNYIAGGLLLLIAVSELL